jgi:hypothetical protein
MSAIDIQKNIEEFGWHFLFIFDQDQLHPVFAYSVGFEASYGHPEIVIFGLPKNTAHAILSDIAKSISEGESFEPNRKYSGVLDGEYEALFKPIAEDNYSQYLGTAVEFYCRPFRALVMFWPDSSNVLPTEPGCTATNQNEALRIV